MLKRTRTIHQERSGDSVEDGKAGRLTNSAHVHDQAGRHVEAGRRNHGAHRLGPSIFDAA
jgi:hypothetical protein